MNAKRKMQPVDPERDVQARIMRKRGFVTVAEAAYLAHVPRQTIYAWVKSAGLLSERVGPRRVYVARAALAELVGPSFGHAA